MVKRGENVRLNITYFMSKTNYWAMCVRVCLYPVRVVGEIEYYAYVQYIYIHFSLINGKCEVKSHVI